MSSSTPFAYSTDDPTRVHAYREALAASRRVGINIRRDLHTLGAGPKVYLNHGMFGSKDELVALEQLGDDIPDGWRVVRGRLEPRRGKPGESARQWLADHQPVDVRQVMTEHGLPRAAWLPQETGFGWRISPPEVFEHDGVLWALYDAEPGESESGFDDQQCEWPACPLSEYYAAKERFTEANS